MQGLKLAGIVVSLSLCQAGWIHRLDVSLTIICCRAQTGSRLKTVVAGVVEGTMQLVVDPLAAALRQERQSGHDAAAAPEPAQRVGFSTAASAQSPALPTNGVGALSMSPSGKWDLVFSRQSRH